MQRSCVQVLTSKAKDHVGGLHEGIAHVLSAARQPVVGRAEVDVAGQVRRIVPC